MQVTVKDKLKRVLHKYPEVFRGKELKMDKLREIYDQIEYGPRVCFTMDRDVMQYVVLSMIMKDGKYQDMSVFSVYELVDIFLGHNEGFLSLGDIRNDVVILYDGFGGMPNKQKGNMVVQIMEQQRVRGGKVWFFFKGKLEQLKSEFPEVIQYMDENQFRVEDIRLKAKKSQDNWEEM